MTRWLQRRFRACGCVLAERPRFEPRLDHQLFISTFHLALYLFAPLFCVLVVCTGHWPTETGRIRRKRLAIFKKNKRDGDRRNGIAQEDAACPYKADGEASGSRHVGASVDVATAGRVGRPRLPRPRPTDG